MLDEFIIKHREFTENDFSRKHSLWSFVDGQLEFIGESTESDVIMMMAVSMHVMDDVPAYAVLYGWAAPNDGSRPSENPDRMRCRVVMEIGDDTTTATCFEGKEEISHEQGSGRLIDVVNDLREHYKEKI